MKNKRLRNIFAVFVAVFLIAMLALTDIDEIIASLKQIKPSLLVFMMLLQLLTETLLTAQWCQVCRLMGLPVKFMPMFLINAKGTVMEAVTPGAKVGGEVTRVLLFQEELGYTANQSISVIAIQKIISIGSLLAMGFIALVLMPGNIVFLKKGQAKLMVMLVLILLLGTLMLMLFVPQKLSEIINKKKARFKWIRAIQSWTADFSLHMSKVRGRKTGLVLQFILSIFIWAIFPYKLILMVNSFGITSNMIGLFSATLLSYMVAMIPLLPGGLGSFEVTMSAMLIMLGLSAEQGLVISISFRFITFWFVVALGLVVIAIGNYIVRRRKSGKSEYVQ